MNDFEALVEELRIERSIDPRTAIFDVRVEPRPSGAVALVGETTDREAVTALARRMRSAAGVDEVLDEVVGLPDPTRGETLVGLVRAAVAPVHVEPHIASTQVSQYVLGHPLDLLSRDESWWRVRGEDGYIGWVHKGFLALEGGRSPQVRRPAPPVEPVVSLGAELVDEADQVFARMPWGARIDFASPGRLRLPDGRSGTLGAGEVIAADRLADRFPPRGESVADTTRRWTGAPYLWGGVTPAGADCSGFVQSVYWMHRIALPRDADLQARVGAVVDPGGDFRELRAGDLLFFAERPGRITHVAISLAGPQIIHSALTNGGVERNDLSGGLEPEQRLRNLFVEARRVVPD